MLRGSRFVLVSEIDEGRMWNMMLINRITGGDPLIARVMRGDPFELVPELRTKLRAEWPAIMRWLIDGAVHYFEKGGLLPPQSVKLSTTDYLETENEVADWLRECTRPDPNAWTSSADLFASWSSWAKSAGTYVGSQKRLAPTLRDMGYQPAHNSKKPIRGFRGLVITVSAANRPTADL